VRGTEKDRGKTRERKRVGECEGERDSQREEEQGWARKRKRGRKREREKETERARESERAREREGCIRTYNRRVHTTDAKTIGKRGVPMALGWHRESLWYRHGSHLWMAWTRALKLVPFPIPCFFVGKERKVK